MELVYTYISKMRERELEFDGGINFSNEFEVALDREDNSIKAIKIYKKENIYNDLYPTCVKSINLLLGINGSGKTSILDLIGSTRHIKKRQWEEWDYFSIYHIKENQFVIEGNNRDLVEKVLVINPNWRDKISMMEYSLMCEYDSTTEKMIVFDFCCQGQWDKGKVLYYKDLSPKKYSWTTKSRHLGVDHEIFFKREDIYPGFQDLCDFLDYADRRQLFENKSFSNLPICIGFNKNYNFECKWENLNHATLKQTFLLLTTFYLVKYCSEYEHVAKALLIEVEEIERKMESRKFDYNKGWMEQLQSKLEGIVAIEEKNTKNHAKTKLLEAIKNLEEEFFSNGMEVFPHGLVIHPAEMIKFYGKNLQNKALIKLIEAMDIINQEYEDFYMISIDNLCAGQAQMIDVFSSIFSKLKKETEHYIVLLDEPDKGMHPEMSRNFISNLIDYAEELCSGTNYTLQFIMTTHSPFVVSDVPIDNVHCLDSNDGMFKIQNADMGLLSNIPDIMKKSFFLESPFGNLANHYFKHIQRCIKELNLSENIAEETNRLSEIIQNINEPVINRFLEKKLEERLGELSMNSPNVRESLIEYYEAKLKILKEL